MFATTRTNRHHSPELKIEVVRKVLDNNGQIGPVAREYGLEASLVRYWMHKYMEVNAKVSIKQRIKSLQAELAQLRVLYRTAAH